MIFYYIDYSYINNRSYQKAHDFRLRISYDMCFLFLGGFVVQEGRNRESICPTWKY